MSVKPVTMLSLGSMEVETDSRGAYLFSYMLQNCDFESDKVQPRN